MHKKIYLSPPHMSGREQHYIFPELTAAAAFTPTRSASCSSNEFTSGPSGAIQFERKASEI